MSRGVELTDSDLELVFEHGSNSLTQALAAVQLAKRQGRLAELEAFIDE